MPKVSQAHIDARKNQILDAAMACFADHGIQETTIKAICDASGLSAGAIYRYFDSKEAILDAVYARSMVQNRAFAERLAASEDPLATIGEMVRGMPGFIGEPSLRQAHHLSIRVHARGLTDPALARSYTALHHDMIDSLRPQLEQLQQAGRIPADLDVEYLLWVLLAAYQGLRVQAMLDPSLDLDRFGDALQHMVDLSLRRP